eukprot:CAMPEP_0169358466 /NCGR_PEP_ID=MMETSP1017-20121227/28705_1 /TAXON_ID=342587 /ORGANISM="Karlodinium micrum, Strain CCMP2283" /LENGTH=81 /DNA_ID=CAMNT_0009455551 /DNA_START=288 /DNA_END=533 /DNA_ORIENTATION=-
MSGKHALSDGLHVLSQQASHGLATYAGIIQLSSCVSGCLPIVILDQQGFIASLVDTLERADPAPLAHQPILVVAQPSRHIA